MKRSISRKTSCLFEAVTFVLGAAAFVGLVFAVADRLARGGF
jgi:hypothetical protein